MNKRTFLKALGLLVSTPILAREQDKSPYMRDYPQDTPKAVRFPEHTENMSVTDNFTHSSSCHVYRSPFDVKVLRARLNHLNENEFEKSLRETQMNWLRYKNITKNATNI